jgi:glutaredoxin
MGSKQYCNNKLKAIAYYVRQNMYLPDFIYVDCTICCVLVLQNIQETGVVHVINRKELSKEQALFLIENKDFQSGVVDNGKTIVVVSQSWCPQWKFLKKWLFNIETDEELTIYELEYDKKEFFNEFMTFKEKFWGNYEVPYLRYYIDGELVEETNYTNEDRIKSIMGL